MFPQTSNEPASDSASPVTPASQLNAAGPAPVATPPAAAPVAAATPPAGSDKKKWIIIGSALAVVLIGGAVSAMWWTSPEKSLSDAMSVNNLVQGGTVKGDIVVTPSDGTPVTIGFDSQYRGFVTKTDLSIKASMGAVKFDITGGFATTANKSLLFKVNDVRNTINSFAGAGNKEAIDQYYGKLINKVDGKWVEVTEADLKDATKDSGSDLSCVMDKTSKLINDKAFLKEASDLYKKNAYISIKEKLGSEKIDGRDSNHVVLAYDKTKAEAYGKALEETSAVKDLRSCVKDSGSSSSSTSSSDTATPKMEVWVDKWSHKITKVMMTQDDKGTSVKFTAVLNYNDTQKVDTPKADTQFKDLKTDMEELQQQFAPSATTTQSITLDSI